jgi:hypothetical protein
VPIPPEVSFDRYFRGLKPSLQSIYEGKHDLEQLENPDLKEILLKLQKGFNFALGNERQVPEHRDHPSFHMDYVRSSVPNALAFRHDGHSFVGVTVPLITTAMKLCGLLSKSTEVLSALGLDLADEVSDAVGFVFLKIILFFIVSHEYTHIVHGHPQSQANDSIPPNEVIADSRTGTIEEQVLELDADSYAIYHIMGNWIDGVERLEGLSLLKMGSAAAGVQDAFLFAVIVIAVGSYFLLRPVVPLDANSVYKLNHPPQPVRLEFLMETAIAWCRQNRPGIEMGMSPDRFNALMSTAAGVIWGSDEERSKNWQTQVTFLRTVDGLEFLRKLRASKNDYHATL